MFLQWCYYWSICKFIHSCDHWTRHSSIAAVICYNVNPGQESVNVIKIVNDLKDNFQDIKGSLQVTNDHLKEAIDCHLVNYEDA